MGKREPRIPVDVDEDLSEGKLRMLLDLKEERSELDYKEAFDNSSTRDKVELAKDVLAMANTNGGYLVLGVRDDGTPVGLSRDQYEQLGGSNLANKVNAYCRPRQASLTLRKHDTEVGAVKMLLALVFVRKKEGLPIFMARDGTYPHPTRKTQECAFRKDDVYVRHDDQSVPMVPEDMERFVSEALASEKESWMAEMARVTADSIQRISRSASTADHLDTATLMIDSDTFWIIVIGLLRKRDEVGLTCLVDLATSHASHTWHDAAKSAADVADRRDSVKHTLDRQCGIAVDKLMLIAAAATRFGDENTLRGCLTAFAELYRIPDTQDVFRKFPDSDGTAYLLWTWFSKAVMTRLYALGGYAVLREAFPAVRAIASQKVQPVTDGQPRQPLVTDPDWRYRALEAGDYFEEATEYLRTRSAVLGILEQQEKQLLDALCQFDLLVDYSLHLEGMPNPFPYFVWHYPQRSLALIQRIKEDSSAVWGPDFDPAHFTEYLQSIPDRVPGIKHGPRWNAYLQEVLKGFQDR